MTCKCSIHTRMFFSLLAVMAFIATLGLLCRTALATPGGSGTEGDPYTVGNADDLQTALNNGGFVRLDDSIGGYFSVSNNKTVNLDLNGKTIHHTGSAEDTLTIARQLANDSRQEPRRRWQGYRHGQERHKRRGHPYHAWRRNRKRRVGEPRCGTGCCCGIERDLCHV